MDTIIDILRGLSWLEASALLLVENLIIFGLAVGLGHLMVRWFDHRRIASPPEPLESREVLLSISTVILNTAVTVVGWWLWREGVIVFREDVGLMAIVDVFVLLAVMDLAMYLLHRVAHIPLLYPWLHKTHHEYENPRPLTLFALNPAEAISFGGLWLVVIVFYDASWLGMSIYLTLNVVFGLIGHLGVEPFPKRWLDVPGLNLLSTSTFHAGHHDDPDHNYGFYTVIWDKLFKTLARSYEERFRSAGDQNAGLNLPPRA